MIDWIVENNILIGAITAIIAVVISVITLFKNNSRDKQFQKSGNNSINIQVGGSINGNTNIERSDKDE